MKHILPIVLLSTLPFYCYTQSDSAVVKLNDKVDKLLKEIEQLEKGASDTIAVIRLHRLTTKDQTGKDVSIKSVEIYLEDGLLKRLRVLSESDEYFQSSRSFLLQDFNRYSSKFKLEKVGVESEYIILGDFLIYLDRLDNSDYSPPDKLIVLSKTNRQETLDLKSDLNSFIDVRIYTDLLALLNKQSNGLIQTEIRSRIPLGIIPASFKLFNLYFFNYLEPSFKLSKFDSEFKSQTVPNSTPYQIDRLKLNQLAYLELGLRLNVVKLRLKQHTFEYLNIGADYKYSDIQVSGQQNVETINAFGYYVETRGLLKKFKNFGFEYSLQAYFQKVKNPEVEFYDISDPYLKTEFGLFYFPKGTEESSIFLRFQSMNSDIEQLFGNTNFFTLLQFGYKSKLKLGK